MEEYVKIYWEITTAPVGPDITGNNAKQVKPIMQYCLRSLFCDALLSLIYDNYDEYLSMNIYFFWRCLSFEDLR